MAWAVVATQGFADWLLELDERARVRILAAIRLVESTGPGRNRPYSDTLKGSTIANLKELRVPVGGSPYRILYAFDPIRRAVMLCGGDKTGDKRFYRRMIPIAEAAFTEHIKSIDPSRPGEAP